MNQAIAPSIQHDTRPSSTRKLEWAAWFGVGIAAILWAGAAFEPLRPTLEAIVGPVLSGGDGTLTQAGLLSTVIMGGIFVGWCVTIALLARDASSHAAVGRAILWGIMVWFVVDSTGSVLVGAAPNVLLNTVFLVVLALPARGMARLNSPAR